MRVSAKWVSWDGGMDTVGLSDTVDVLEEVELSN